MLLIACALTHAGTAAASTGGDLGQRESAEEAEAVAPALARDADDDAEQHAAADASVPTAAAAAGPAANSLDDDESSAAEDGDAAAAARPTPEEVPSGGAAAQPGGATPADEQPGAAQVDAQTTAATRAGAGASTGAASAGAGASAPAATATPQRGPTGQYNGHRQHQVDLDEEAEIRRLESGDDGGLGGSSGADQPTSGAARRERAPDDVDVTQLDEDDSLDDAAHEEGSMMHAFIVAVRTRLKHELSAKFPSLEKPWLREELAARSWWLRAERANWVYQRLSEEEQREAGLVQVDWNALYVRDIYVWLPDVRWPGTMPACPHCLNAEEVGNHGFCDNHYARRCAAACPAC